MRIMVILHRVALVARSAPLFTYVAEPLSVNSPLLVRTAQSRGLLVVGRDMMYAARVAHSVTQWNHVFLCPLRDAASDVYDICVESYVSFGDVASFLWVGAPNATSRSELRTRLRVAGTTGDSCVRLRGGVIVAAQDVGFGAFCDLTDDRGTGSLLRQMREMVFPPTQHESKDLLGQYCQLAGPLSTERGESVKECVSRRGRSLMAQIDPAIFLSEGHRAGYDSLDSRKTCHNSSVN